MTDAPLEPPANDPDLDDELVFGDIAPPAPKKPRRTPARGRDAAELPQSAGPDGPLAEEPADPPAPVPQPGDASAGSASSRQSPRDRGRIVLLAIVGLALFTSLMSLGGLIAVSRTLAAAQAQREQASSERAELARLPAMIAALDRANAQLAVVAARASGPAIASPAATPLTSDDFHHGLDALRLAMDNHQPAGASAIGDTLHSGFAEMAVRLDRIEAQLARPGAVRTPAPR